MKQSSLKWKYIEVLPSCPQRTFRGKIMQIVTLQKDGMLECKFSGNNKKRFNIHLKHVIILPWRRTCIN